MGDSKEQETTSRRALVTGGNRGIGEAISRRLAAAGFEVALTYRSRQDEAEALAEELGARCYAVDMADAEQVRNLARRFQEELGPVEVLVHNAGMTRDAPLAFIKEEQWDEVLDVNLKGPFLLT
ncbi:MAG: SDR family NAD(P)-dependent oxidoreductase, partial [Acidobacteria bacterium]|nr:SDR family NAD(P)-dependent oxidoreductase [Acidobacteriota bacterium]